MRENMKHCVSKSIIIFSLLLFRVIHTNESDQKELSPLSQAITVFETHASFNADDKKIIQLLPAIIEHIVTKNNYSITTKFDLELMLNFKDLSHGLKMLSNKLIALELITPLNHTSLPAISVIKRAVDNIIELEQLEADPESILSRACNTNALIDSIREKINSLRQLIIIQFNILESIIETIVVQNCCAELNSKLDIIIADINFILTASCPC